MKPMATKVKSEKKLKDIQRKRAQRTDKGIARMRKRISAFAGYAHYKLAKEVLLP